MNDQATIEAGQTEPREPHRWALGDVDRLANALDDNVSVLRHLAQCPHDVSPSALAALASTMRDQCEDLKEAVSLAFDQSRQAQKRFEAKIAEARTAASQGTAAELASLDSSRRLLRAAAQTVLAGVPA